MSNTNLAETIAKHLKKALEANMKPECKLEEFSHSRVLRVEIPCEEHTVGFRIHYPDGYDDAFRIVCKLDVYVHDVTGEDAACPYKIIHAFEPIRVNDFAKYAMEKLDEMMGYYERWVK